MANSPNESPLHAVLAEHLRQFNESHADLAELARHELERRNALAVTLSKITAFIASDALAISYQSLGEYRTALLRMLREAQANTEST